MNTTRPMSELAAQKVRARRGETSIYRRTMKYCAVLLSPLQSEEPLTSTVNASVAKAECPYRHNRPDVLPSYLTSFSFLCVIVNADHLQLPISVRRGVRWRGTTLSTR